MVMGTTGMGVSAERGLTHGGSAELAPPQRQPWRWRRWVLRRSPWHAAIIGLEELIWAGWTQQSQRKSASALMMARLPQANPLVERPGIRVWTKFLMHRLNFLFSLQACRGTIRCLVILFPSNRKVLATPHS